MSKITENLLLPPSRVVAGSLYTAKTTDAEGRPKVTKDGQPKIEYWFAIAIPKGAERHWAETAWGQAIWGFGHRVFPDAAKALNFAWKITDGDSQQPNSKGKKPCEKEGHPGHWILGLGSKFPPNVLRDAGRKQVVEVDFVNPGDYVEAYIGLASNTSSQSPGIHLNPVHVNFLDHGERIEFRPDAESVGFTGTLPRNAQVVRFSPAGPDVTLAPASYTTPATPAPLPPNVTPHHAILQPQSSGIAPPPPNASPARVMTELAKGYTYEQYISQNWTDAQLIAAGMMLP